MMTWLDTLDSRILQWLKIVMFQRFVKKNETKSMSLHAKLRNEVPALDLQNTLKPDAFFGYIH